MAGWQPIETAPEYGQAILVMPAIGGLYNWIGRQERLVYMGTTRYPGDHRIWHQFAKVTTPNVCWSEILTAELVMLEETKGS